MTSISFRQDQLVKLKKKAKELGIPLTEMVRRIVDQFFEKPLL